MRGWGKMRGEGKGRRRVLYDMMWYIDAWVGASVVELVVSPFDGGVGRWVNV